MKILTFLALFFFPFTSFAQDCNCTSNFNWVKKTFEANDAGYQYIIDNKGIQAYELHNQIFIEKIKATKDISKCQEVINDWLHFFRKGHIAFQYIGNQATSQSDKQSSELDIKPQAKKWETFAMDIDDFKKYLDEKSTLDFEGVWASGPYKIGIKKNGNSYIGFIIESSAKGWQPDQVKLKITTIDDKHKSLYYMLDRSGVESEQVDLIGKNYLQLGDITLNRIHPVIEENPKHRLHFKALNTALPFMEQLNANTLYFRIPSFTGTPEKLAIDSVIATNREKILSTENLIIDIRNGTGGSDNSYAEIIPLLYTNPIRTPQVEFRSTPLNNQRMLDFSNNEGMTLEYGLIFTEEERKEFKESYDKLTKHIGAFVNLDTTAVHKTTFDTIYPFPKNVGIIHNQRNGSTDEQFLLAANQSKKVKTFGRTTGGMLDVSNMNKATSECGDFVLWYALSKSLRIPEMAIDDIGVQPDYYIDAQIPNHEWINYVSKILNE